MTAILMPSLAILYAFHRIDSMSMKRLMWLRDRNPDALIVPYLGLRPRRTLPIPLNKKRPKYANMYLTRFQSFLNFSRAFHERNGSTISTDRIRYLHRELRSKGLTLYCDYTPFGDFHQDLAVLRWFHTEGKNIDFDFLIFHEYDMITARPVSRIYERYLGYDACFVDFGFINPGWSWYDKPRGSIRSMQKWLKKNGERQEIFHGLFAGHIVSRKVLTRLENEHSAMPFAFCEVRWPTIISDLGFRCQPLDFPMVNAGDRPKSLQSIIDRMNLGIFHPVREDFDLATVFADKNPK